jgi:hypothetical protein
MPATTPRSRHWPRHIAVIGAAGGLGQGILSVCREEKIGSTAIVRSRPERITDRPPDCRVAIVTSLADSWMPGRIGRGAAEQQAVVHALGRGAFASLRWTLVRAGVNARGKDEHPVASLDWDGAPNSWMPVSYRCPGVGRSSRQSAAIQSLFVAILFRLADDLHSLNLVVDIQ